MKYKKLLLNNLNIIEDSTELSTIYSNGLQLQKDTTVHDNMNIDFPIYFTFNEILNRIEFSEEPYHEKYKLLNRLDTAFNNIYSISNESFRLNILDQIKIRLLKSQNNYNNNTYTYYISSLFYDLIDTFRHIRKDNLYYIYNTIWGAIIYRYNYDGGTYNLCSSDESSDEGSDEDSQDEGSQDEGSDEDSPDDGSDGSPDEASDKGSQDEGSDEDSPDDGSDGSPDEASDEGSPDGGSDKGVHEEGSDEGNISESDDIVQIDEDILASMDIIGTLFDYFREHKEE